jgi:hypothetical protein
LVIGNVTWWKAREISDRAETGADHRCTVSCGGEAHVREQVNPVRFVIDCCRIRHLRMVAVFVLYFGEYVIICMMKQ